jgi:hypothetical protein
MPMTTRRCIMLLGLAAIVTGCATSEPGAARTLAALEDDLKACTARHGYDPAQTGSLGPHQLAPTERAWRDCVYAGVEKHVIPQAFAPDAYRRLVARDKELTDQVAAGKITRADRGVALSAAFEEIDRDNAAAAAQAMANPVRRQTDQTGTQEIRRRLSPLGR